MDTTEAIKILKDIKDKKQAAQLETTTSVFAKSLFNFKNIIVSTMVELTKLLLDSQPKVTVKNFPSVKTQEKLLKSINKNLIELNKGVKCIAECMKKENDETKED